MPAPGARVEVWFQDEARIGQKNSLTRVWGQTGSRPVAPKDLGFASAYLFGAVCPSAGKAAALIMPICNTAAMNHHLCEISSQVAADAHAVVILDGASWHNSHGLVVPSNITLLALPPYSPELNPVERIWHYLRSHWLANSVFRSLADIMDACEMAWNRFATNTGLVRSLCAVAWAPASSASIACACYRTVAQIKDHTRVQKFQEIRIRLSSEAVRPIIPPSVATQKARSWRAQRTTVGGQASRILFSSPARPGPSRIPGAGRGPLCGNRLHQAARKAGVPPTFPREARTIR